MAPWSASYLGFVEQAVVVQEHLAFLPSEPPQVPLKLLREKRSTGLKPGLRFPLSVSRRLPSGLTSRVNVDLLFGLDLLYSLKLPTSGSRVSYSRAGPAQQGEGVAVHRRRHQVDPHRPPAPAVLLPALQALLHLAGLQPQDQETLGEVVHGLEAVSGQLGQVEGGRLVVAVEQKTLMETQTGPS